MLIPVFDIGGVLLDWDPRYLYRTLFAGDTVAMEAFLATVCPPEWNRTLDAGIPFAAAIEERVARFPDHAALIRAYRERWPEMIPRAFDDTVAVLSELKESGARLYAITNFAAETFALARHRWPFLGWFDGIVVSGEERVLKPEPAIYRCLIERYGLDAGSCLFIDDVPANVAGARAVGMQAVEFTGAARLRRDLAAAGLLA